MPNFIQRLRQTLPSRTPSIDSDKAKSTGRASSWSDAFKRNIHFKPKSAATPLDQKKESKRLADEAFSSASKSRTLKKIFHSVSSPLYKITHPASSKEKKITNILYTAGYSQIVGEKASWVNPKQLTGKLKAFDAGALNTVYSANFKGEDGQIQEKIIKFEAHYEDNKDMPQFLQSAKVLPQNTREAARNLAAKALDDILGWNNIIPTQIGVLKDPKSKDYKVVIFMDKAEGTSGYGSVFGYQELPREALEKYLEFQELLKEDPTNADMFGAFLNKLGILKPEDLNEIKDGETIIGLKALKRTHNIDPKDPKLKEELIKLQLQDLIMNQGDRHIGNYYIKTQAKGPGEKEAVLGITGIDNDLLGGMTNNINSYNKNTMEMPTKVPCPPPEIPSSICSEILEIDESSFRSKMEMYLGKDEADAAVQRLGQVKEHVRQVLINNFKNGEGSCLYPYAHNNSYYVNFLAVHFPEEASKMVAVTPSRPIPV